MKSLDWYERAACGPDDAELFFPEPGQGQGEAAHRICARCPVRDECLDWATASGQKHGIYGGAGYEARLRRKARARAA